MIAQTYKQSPKGIFLQTFGVQVWQLSVDGSVIVASGLGFGAEATPAGLFYLAFGCLCFQRMAAVRL